MTNSLYFWVAVGWLWLATSLASAQVLKGLALMVTEVVAGLNAPTVMAFIGPDDILVLKKNDGQVRRVIGGLLQPTPVLDVALNQLSERGLLGMALYPAFSLPHGSISTIQKAVPEATARTLPNPLAIVSIVTGGTVTPSSSPN